MLSHVLAREGFNGVGIDARSRGIWDRFKAEGTDLRKTSMDPNDVDCISLPSNVDFIIGNHADQLLPWVPVIAARCFYILDDLSILHIISGATAVSLLSLVAHMTSSASSTTCRRTRIREVLDVQKSINTWTTLNRSEHVWDFRCIWTN